MSNARVVAAYCGYNLGTKGTTSVVFTIAPVMMTAAAKARADGSHHMLPTSLSGFIFAVSLLLQCVGALLLGELADVRGWRLPVLVAHVALGLLAMTALGLLPDAPGVLSIAVLQVVIFYAMGLASNFYSALLPLVAPQPLRPTVSLASGCCAAVGGMAFLLLQYEQLATEGPGHAAAASPAVLRRICLLAAATWLATSLLSLAYLFGSRLERGSLERGEQPRAAPCGLPCPSLAGWRRLATRQPHAARFVLAQALYLTAAMGDASIGTVFAAEVLGLNVRGLTLLTVSAAAAAAAGSSATLLLVRVAGVPEATMLYRLMAVSPLLVTYLSLFLAEEAELLVLTVARGVVAGGVGFQGLNRGLFASMIPRGREAEMFGLWTVAIKALCWLGPFVDAVLNEVSGSLRVAVLGSLLFYVPSLVVMGRVDVEAARREAEHAATLMPVAEGPNALDDLAAAVREEWLGPAEAEVGGLGLGIGLQQPASTPPSAARRRMGDEEYVYSRVSTEQRD